MGARSSSISEWRETHPAIHIIHLCVGEGLAVSMGVLKYLRRHQTIDFYILFCHLAFMDLKILPLGFHEHS